MNEIKEFLPFLIPLIIAELVLLIYTLRHILTHDKFKRGDKVIWLIIVVVGMQFIVPILYFIFGKED